MLYVQLFHSIISIYDWWWIIDLVLFHSGKKHKLYVHIQCIINLADFQICATINEENIIGINNTQKQMETKYSFSMNCSVLKNSTRNLVKLIDIVKYDLNACRTTPYLFIRKNQYFQVWYDSSFFFFFWFTFTSYL